MAGYTKIIIPSNSTPAQCACALRWFRTADQQYKEIWMGRYLLAVREHGTIKIYPDMRDRVEMPWGNSWDIKTNLPEIKRV